MRTRLLALMLLLSLAVITAAHATACLSSVTYNVTGTRIRYIAASGGTGTDCSSGTPCTLAQALNTLIAGDTLILGAGTYQLNLFTQNGIFINAVNNVTIRGVDATSCDTTILDGNGMDNTPSGSNPSGAADGVNYGIWSNSANTTIAHLTIRNIYTHPINFNEGAATPVLHQVRLQNAGEQSLKINPPALLATPGITGGLIEDTLMEYTAGPPTVDHGGGVAYWNAISAHRAINWTLRRSWFLNFHNPDGVGAQYQGAVLLWNCSTGWLVEQNTFFNNDLAMAIGLQNPVPSGCGTYDASNTTIRNNVVVQTTGFFTGTRSTNSDGQINVWNADNTKVYHNTILNHGSSTHAMQVRWLTSPISDLQNNLTDDTINLRDSAAATNTGNYLTAVDAWFVGPQTGDAHLNDVAGTQANVINQAPTLAAVTNDFYGVSRPQGPAYDRGAIEVEVEVASAPGIYDWPRLFVRETCVLGWTAPTTNTDASPLTDLDHFRVCVAASTGGACTNSYTFSAATLQATCGQVGLTVSPSPYFLRVYAVDSASNESPASNEREIRVTRGRTFMRP